MKFKSAVFTQASGSVGGLTFSRNKGGMYTRARAIPVNPSTAFQVAVRTIMADLSNLWVSTLTQTQRDAWDLYALNTPLTDVLGDPRTVTGMNMYVRCNLPRLQVGEPRVDTGPVVFTLGAFTPVTVVAAVALPGMAVTFTPADVWANEDDAAMIVQLGRPVNPSVNFYSLSYRQAGVIQGDALIAPTSPQTIAPPFPLAVGQKLFGIVRVSRADGRLSAAQQVSAIVA